MKMLAFLRVVPSGVAGWASARGSSSILGFLLLQVVLSVVMCTLVRMQACVWWWLALSIILGIPAGEEPLWDWI